MDGYHLTRAQLDALPDPATAHARRGAEFTFDGAGFLKLVEALRAPLGPTSPTVFAPSFDHAVKDPKEDDIAVLASQRIVVFEGNCESLLVACAGGGVVSFQGLTGGKMSCWISCLGLLPQS